MLLVVEVVAFCGGAVPQVNGNLKPRQEKLCHCIFVTSYPTAPSLSLAEKIMSLKK
jgi:hypothetical protein